MTMARLQDLNTEEEWLAEESEVKATFRRARNGLPLVCCDECIAETFERYVTSKDCHRHFPDEAWMSPGSIYIGIVG